MSFLVLSMAEHVRAIIHNCVSSLHALRVLWSHGLNDAALQTVYRAAVVTRLTYAISAWWGFTTADDHQRIKGFLRCGTRSGFYRPDWPSIEILVEDAADALFHRVLGNRSHLLHLPDKNRHGYNLWHRRHNRILASNHDQRNFIGSCINTVTNSPYLHHIHCWIVFCQFLLNEYVMLCYVSYVMQSRDLLCQVWQILQPLCRKKLVCLHDLQHHHQSIQQLPNVHYLLSHLNRYLAWIISNLMLLCPYLAKQCALLLTKKLHFTHPSYNNVVKSASMNGVYFMRMFPALCINAQLCCDYYGLSLHSIRMVCKKLAWSVFYCCSILLEVDKIHTIEGLLCVKFDLVSLPLFDVAQVDFRFIVKK